MQKTDIMLTKNAMGHADIKTTEIYVENTSTEKRKDAASKMVIFRNSDENKFEK